MSDKDLSKPMGYANKFSLEYAQRSGCEFAVYASDDVQGYDVPVYSAEYVQSLLKRIAELEAERETMHSIEYVSSLLARIESMAPEKAQRANNSAPTILRKLAEEKQKRGEVAAATAFNYATSALQKELSK